MWICKHTCGSTRETWKGGFFPPPCWGKHLRNSLTWPGVLWMWTLATMSRLYMWGSGVTCTLTPWTIYRTLGLFKLCRAIPLPAWWEVGARLGSRLHYLLVWDWGWCLLTFLSWSSMRADHRAHGGYFLSMASLLFYSSLWPPAYLEDFIWNPCSFPKQVFVCLKRITFPLSVNNFGVFPNLYF